MRGACADFTDARWDTTRSSWCAFAGTDDRGHSAHAKFVEKMLVDREKA